MAIMSRYGLVAVKLPSLAHLSMEHVNQIDSGA